MIDEDWHVEWIPDPCEDCGEYYCQCLEDNGEPEPEEDDESLS